ncbi:MAG TPA: adhesin [Pseudonocardia sp.]|jgi:Fe-S cluster assembly iron-binding protein IscA
MLAITENAADAINALVSQGELPDGAGARIAADERGDGLELAMAPSPAPNDTVVRDHGAAVFLEQTAARVLTDKTLDVEPVPEQGAQGQLRFTIVPGTPE